MANHNRSDDSKGKLRRSLEERLKDHPDLIGRLEALADIVENAGDEVEKADEAERRVLEQVRHIGHGALQGWAERQQRKKADHALSQPRKLKRKGKKT